MNEQIFPKVVTVIDHTIESSSAVFALRGLSTSSTIFLTGSDIVSYLKRLETSEHPLHVIDFEGLKTEAPAAPAANPAKKEKEDARIEGAAQIAIGIKKEVDFPGWYTNVRPYLFFSTRNRVCLLLNPPGPCKSRYARLLQRQRVLYPQALVV